MIRAAKRFLFRTLIAAVLILAFGLSVYAHQLLTHFPNLDFSRWRIGVVSWYSEKDPYINEHTASGEPFDDNSLTCASWDFDFNEKLLVINLMNGKYVACRVNDRGPAKRLRREVDLTRAAFRRIA